MGNDKQPVYVAKNVVVAEIPHSREAVCSVCDFRHAQSASVLDGLCRGERACPTNS